MIAEPIAPADDKHNASEQVCANFGLYSAKNDRPHLIGHITRIAHEAPDSLISGSFICWLLPRIDHIALVNLREISEELRLNSKRDSV